MNSNKSGNGNTVIFILIAMVVVTALASYVVTKYRLINQKEVEVKELVSNIDTEHAEITIDKYKAPYFLIGNKKLIALNENETIKDLIKNFKYCSIQAGMPIEVKQNEAGLFEVTRKSPLKIHEDTNLILEVGDRIIGTEFLMSGSEIGKVKTLQILKPDDSIKDVKYTVVPVINCM